MTDTQKIGFAMVEAALVWACQPFVDQARKRDSWQFLDGELIIEPCATGGAIIVAVSSTAMIAMLDPDGVCSAPMTLSLPDEIFDACAPRDPIGMNYCGESYELPMPEWSQPGQAAFHGAGTFVLPKMRHPRWAEKDDEFLPCLYNVIASLPNHHHIGRDYRWRDGAKTNWRMPLRNAISAKPSSTPISVSPDDMALFVRARNLVGRPSAVFLRSGDPDGPVLVTIEGTPEFIGTVMPFRRVEYQEPADWFESVSNGGAA